MMAAGNFSIWQRALKRDRLRVTMLLGAPLGTWIQRCAGNLTQVPRSAPAANLKPLTLFACSRCPAAATLHDGRLKESGLGTSE